MFSFFSEIFEESGITLWAPISLKDCIIRKPYLLEKAGITEGTVILFAVPYYTPACDNPDRNLSAYAVSKDYHGFFSAFYRQQLPKLRKAFPNALFAAFSDHSPIDEINAALRLGLGVLGDNHLLITEQYSSYVFLGEIVTSGILPTELREIRYCEHCGNCQKHCPMPQIGNCLSALTQQKGTLTETEEEQILRYGSVWGCDICQEVCPHTKKALRERSIYSPIPYFSQEPTPLLTVQLLDSMSEEEFARRAYAWRGRNTIRRNLLLAEKNRK